MPRNLNHDSLAIKVISALAQIPLSFTYGEAVVDEGVDGADPEDEEAPHELPGRLVPEHGPVVLKIQHGAAGVQFNWENFGLKNHSSFGLRFPTLIKSSKWVV